MVDCTVSDHVGLVFATSCQTSWFDLVFTHHASRITDHPLRLINFMSKLTWFSISLFGIVGVILIGVALNQNQVGREPVRQPSVVVEPLSLPRPINNSAG